ncbi:hypothetical protein D3C81_2183980 [compost metagenome]
MIFSFTALASSAVVGTTYGTNPVSPVRAAWSGNMIGSFSPMSPKAMELAGWVWIMAPMDGLA